jgi:hypothetical protein
MKRLIPIALVLSLAACAGASPVQSTAQVCGIYSSTLISLTVYKPKMTAGQIQLVDNAVAILAPVCEGEIPDADASDTLLDSLDSIELLLLQLKKGDV